MGGAVDIVLFVTVVRWTKRVFRQIRHKEALKEN